MSIRTHNPCDGQRRPACPNTVRTDLAHAIMMNYTVRPMRRISRKRTGYIPANTRQPPPHPWVGFHYAGGRPSRPAFAGSEFALKVRAHSATQARVLLRLRRRPSWSALPGSDSPRPSRPNRWHPASLPATRQSGLWVAGTLVKNRRLCEGFGGFASLPLRFAIPARSGRLWVRPLSACLFSRFTLNFNEPYFWDKFNRKTRPRYSYNRLRLGRKLSYNLPSKTSSLHDESPQGSPWVSPLQTTPHPWHSNLRNRLFDFEGGKPTLITLLFFDSPPPKRRCPLSKKAILTGTCNRFGASISPNRPQAVKQIPDFPIRDLLMTSSILAGGLKTRPASAYVGAGFSFWFFLLSAV